MNQKKLELGLPFRGVFGMFFGVFGTGLQVKIAQIVSLITDQFLVN